MRKNIIDIRTMGVSLGLIATLMTSPITVLANGNIAETNNTSNYMPLGVRQEAPPKLGERGTPPPVLGERKEPSKLGERKDTNKQVTVEVKKEEGQKDNKGVTPKKQAPKKKTTSSKPVKKKTTPNPKPVEEKIEVIEEVVEEVIEEIVEEIPIEEVTGKIFSITTNRYDIGTVDNTPYELLSPIVTEPNGARKQYITRAEVSEILYTMLELEVEPGMGPYQDIDSTIYLMPAVTAIRHGLMTPVSPTEFGAWDKITWSELSHIVRKVKSSKGMSGRSMLNKNMGIEEIIYNNIESKGAYPTKSNVVRILEGIVIGR